MPHVSHEDPVLVGRKPVKHQPTLREQINDIVADCCCFGPMDGVVTGEMRLLEDMGADSLDQVEMAISLEEQFALPEIDDRVVDKWVFVQDLYSYVEKAIVKR